MCDLCDKIETDRQQSRAAGALTRGWYLLRMILLVQEAFVGRAVALLHAFAKPGEADIPASFFEEAETHFLTLAEMAGAAKDARTKPGESFI